MGKSSLFNRIAGKRKAIVQEEQGTTRDRVTTQASWQNRDFLLFDTGGYMFSKNSDFSEAINREVSKALEEANLIFFVCDAKAGVQPQDELFADRLRARAHQVILVINKLDSIEKFGDADQFYRLGFKNVVKLSALHGLGISDLLDLAIQKIPETDNLQYKDSYTFSICMTGEPNSGKSTYFNALLSEERAIVSEIPGTTRDVLEELIEYKEKKIILRDTAGIRPSKSSDSPIAVFSISRAKKAIESSEVVLFLADGHKGLGQVSKQILSFIVESRKPCVILVNKWDLVHEFEQSKYIDLFHKRVPFVNFYPIVFISAKTGKNILKPLDEALRVYENHTRSFKTHDLNKFLERLKKKHQVHGAIKLKFLVQIKNAPPRFLLMGKGLEQLKTPAVQFIKNEIMDYFELDGTPVQITLRNEKK